MEITVYNHNRKTPGNEYLEAIDLLGSNKICKDEKIKERPAVLFLVNHGTIKVRPAFSLSSAQLSQESLLEKVSEGETADIDRNKNYCTLINPSTDILKTRNYLKAFLEYEQKYNLPDMILLLNEEPQGTCIYVKFLSQESSRITRLKYVAKIATSINSTIKYHASKRT